MIGLLAPSKWFLEVQNYGIGSGEGLKPAKPKAGTKNVVKKAAKHYELSLEKRQQLIFNVFQRYFKDQI
ncbi:MAG: hypothetical protein QXO15_02745 [Nitrososphaerota archaeon]